MRKNNKEEIDEIIKETLTKEEAKFYDELDEQDLFGKVGAVFKGKYGWLVVIMNVVSLLAFGFLIYCTVQFFNTSDTNDLIMWAAGGICCVLLVSLLKLFFWMQMDKNDILRELKRLELHIAVFANKATT